MFVFIQSMSCNWYAQELRELGEVVGVVSRGAPSAVIQALPLARYIAAEDNLAAKPGKLIRLENIFLHAPLAEPA